MGLAPVPERLGFLICERSFPAFRHFELTTHRAEGAWARLANRHQSRDRPSMSLDHDLLAIFDKIEEL